MNYHISFALSLVLVAAAYAYLIWAVKNGRFFRGGYFFGHGMFVYQVWRASREENPWSFWICLTVSFALVTTFLILTLFSYVTNLKGI